MGLGGVRVRDDRIWLGLYKYGLGFKVSIRVRDTIKFSGRVAVVH